MGVNVLNFKGNPALWLAIIKARSRLLIAAKPLLGINALHNAEY
jgi:hypothetical protein